MVRVFLFSFFLSPFAFALLACGCHGRPHAPALRDEPVYQNSREGFRLLAPEGWTQSAKAESPAGTVDKQYLLVRYDRLTGAAASLEVALVDLPSERDLEAYLAGGSHGVAAWRRAAAPEPLSIGGADGMRFVSGGRAGKQELTKEVTAFRRGDRVYLFTGVFPTGDTTARAQLRRSVDSLLWKT
jgi:predicted Zn-dependent protease